MSAHADDDDQVGYRKPPKQHQFQKGRSGNPKGRPRKPRMERAVSKRQIWRDILAVTEAPVTVNTSQGPKRMPTITALLLSCRDKAFKGHAPSQRYLHKIHTEAVTAREEAHPEEFELLDSYERAEFRGEHKDSPEFQKDLNRYRRLSKKT